jgi:hypothetical protein
MELEAQTQAEAGQQAEAWDDVELELLLRSLGAFPDEPVDQLVQQGYRLGFAAARMGRIRPARFCHREREEQAVKIRLSGASQDPARGELVPGRARPISPAATGFSSQGSGMRLIWLPSSRPRPSIDPARPAPAQSW